MEPFENIDEFLEIIDRPAFLVQGGVITRMNKMAERRNVVLGQEILKMLNSQCPEYQTFTDGILYLSVFLHTIECHATVRRYKEGDLFLLERNYDYMQLQNLAMIAQKLRVPLTNMMAITDELLPQMLTSEDSQERNQALQYNKSFHQILHLLANMADAERYYDVRDPDYEVTNLTFFFNRIMSKLGPMVEEAGMKLNYTGAEKIRHGLADKPKLERAVHNMLSNAIKFSPQGATIDVSTTIDGDRLRFIVRDYGDGFDETAWTTLYSRYQRDTAVEDSRYGLGLGMMLISNAARLHGGAVLLEKAEGYGTKISFCMRIHTGTSPLVRTPQITMTNYVGGRDPALVELSDVLPASAYDEVYPSSPV